MVDRVVMVAMLSGMCCMGALCSYLSLMTVLSTRSTAMPPTSHTHTVTTMSDVEQELIDGLSGLLLDADVDGLDEDLIAYIAGMLGSKADEDPASLEESVEEVLFPFLESVQCPDNLAKQAEALVMTILQGATVQTPTAPASATRKLRQGVVSLSDELGVSEEEAEAHRYLWGTDSGVKAMANTLIDAQQEKLSAKDKRKIRKAEAEQARKLLASKADHDADQDASGGLVRMNYHDVSKAPSADKKKDVLVRNVTVSLDNGTALLESGEIKFAYQRRYGLIGENGVGKSTLLKAISNDGIEGFPVHLRVLHVRQEVPAYIAHDLTVTDAVLQSDVERMTLLKQAKEILAKLEQAGTVADGLSIAEKRKKLQAGAEDMKELNADLKKLDGVYARLQVLSSDAAEARVAMILTGLQFTPEMQKAKISSLSGGWKMRVALAAALFIEPDICMVSAPVDV